MTAPARQPKALDETILSIAKIEFALYGFEGTRIDEIADKVGVNKATLYYRIGKKRDLYSIILSQVVCDRVAQMERILISTKDTQERLRRYSLIMIDTKHVHHDFALMMRAHIEDGRNATDKVRKMFRRMRDVLKQILSDGVANGDISPTEPLLSELFLMLAYGLDDTRLPEASRGRAKLLGNNGAGGRT